MTPPRSTVRPRYGRLAAAGSAVTVVIPATGKPHRQSDNLLAGSEATLDAAQRAELIAMFA